jgi:FkbM family methyltransferase
MKAPSFKRFSLAPGSYGYRMAHRVGLDLHRFLARHPRAAERWFGALSALRFAPAGSHHQRLLNSVAAVRWPELRVAPQRVVLGSSTSVVLRPHPGEPDFEALLTPRLHYEPEVFRWLESHLGDYDTVVEIGANVGMFTVFMAAHSRRAGTGRPRIVAFEPSRTAFARLLDNLALNDCQVEAFNCAVGERAGVAQFHEPAGHGTNGSLDRAFAGIFSPDVRSQPVLVVGAAEIAALVGEPGRTLLKIDVEGSEPIVLRGLRSWLSAVRPDVIIEVLPMSEAPLRAGDFFRELGYAFYRFEPPGPVPVAPYAASPQHRDHLLLAPRLP